MDKPKLPSFAKIGEKVDRVVETADAAFNRLSAELLERGGAPALVANFLHKRFQRKAVEHVARPLMRMVDSRLVDVSVGEQPTSPYIEADKLMDAVVNLVGPNVNDRFSSRTPLDPHSVRLGYLLPYSPVVQGHQEMVIEGTLLESGIPHNYAEVIDDEITTGSTNRYSRNVAALSRLKIATSGQQLDRETADLIWRAKFGDLATHEVGSFLLQFPQMKSISAEHSIHPLNWDGFEGMDKFVYEQLFECGKKDGVDMTMWHAKAKERNTRYTDSVNGPIITGVEQTIAELTKDEVTVQLVRHDRFIALPPDLVLQKVAPRIITSAGVTANQQPIESSLHWQVKPVKPVEEAVPEAHKSRRLFRK